MLADQLNHVFGHDPHRDGHALAIVDVHTGVVGLETSVEASGSAPGRRALAIEGTDSFGVGPTRFLHAEGERMLEVVRLRRERRSGMEQ